MKKAEYRPVVGINNTDSSFRSTKAPAKLIDASLGTTHKVKRLDYEVFDDETGKLKFFLPPGTVAFNANLYYFYVQEEGKVILRLGEVPVTQLSEVTSANAGGPIDERVLLGLIAGREVTNYSPGLPANSLPLSSPNSPVDPMQIGGWVYGRYQYPGGRLQRGLLQVYVKVDDYEKWFNNPNTKWDAKGNPDENSVHSVGIPPEIIEEDLNLEQLALARANQSGLTEALSRFGRVESEAELVTRAVESGVWGALLEFMRLSSKG